MNQDQENSTGWRTKAVLWAKHRSWFIPLLAVIGSAAIAYPVEVAIIEGMDAIAQSGLLLLAGLLAAWGIASLWFADVRIGRELGIHIHLEVLQDSSHRRRHDTEHRLLSLDLESRTPFASLAAPITTQMDPSPQKRIAAIGELSSQVADTVAIGAALIPGVRSVTVLPAGDLPMLAHIGAECARLLPGWEIYLLSDRMEDAKNPFTRFRVPDTGSSETAKTAGPAVAALQLAIAPRTSTKPFLDWWKRHSEVSHAWARGVAELIPLDRNPEPGPEIRPGGRLPEDSSEYSRILEDVSGTLGPADDQYLALACPSALAFGSGWVLSRRWSPSEPARLHTLSYDKNQDRYGDNPPVPASGDADPVVVRESTWWESNRSLVVGTGAALLLTTGAGNFATWLEWLLAGSNRDSTIAHWLWLTGTVLVTLLLGLGLRTWTKRWTAPEISLHPLSKPTTSVEAFHLYPRRTPELDDSDLPRKVVRWLDTALSNINDLYPESPVVIDLDPGRSTNLGNLPATHKAIGNYLARVQRGTDISLNLGRWRVPRTGLWDLPESGHALSDVGSGYQCGPYCEHLWNSATAQPGR